MAKRDLGAINADEALKELATNFPSTTPQPKKQPESIGRPGEALREEDNVPEHALTVRIPMSVATELRMAHARTGKSHRLIVLEALRTWGIPVREEDLVDRRKRSSSAQ